MRAVRFLRYCEVKRENGPKYAEGQVVFLTDDQIAKWVRREAVHILTQDEIDALKPKVKIMDKPLLGETKPVETKANEAAPKRGKAKVETKTYSDGTTATGTAPLPDQSPAQQDKGSADAGSVARAADVGGQDGGDPGVGAVDVGGAGTGGAAG